MNYKRIYDEIINKARNEKRIKGGKYYEEHHIVPKCLGGDNSKNNKVLLTAREHFLCHWLLYKIHKHWKLACAWNMFCMNTYNGNRPISHLYEYTRILYSKEMKSRISSGLFIPHSPKKSIWIKKGDICKRVKNDELEYYLNNGWVKGRIIKNRKKATKQTKDKISRSLSGRKMSDDIKRIHSRNNKGRVWIHNPISRKHKFIKKDILQDMLNDGWVIGDKRKIYKLQGLLIQKGEENNEKRQQFNRSG